MVKVKFLLLDAASKFGKVTILIIISTNIYNKKATNHYTDIYRSYNNFHVLELIKCIYIGIGHRSYLQYTRIPNFKSILSLFH